MYPRYVGLGRICIVEEAIFVHLEDVEEPISVPRNRYPYFKEGDFVEVTYTSVGALKLKLKKV